MFRFKLHSICQLENKESIPHSALLLPVCEYYAHEYTVIILFDNAVLVLGVIVDFQI